MERILPLVVLMLLLPLASAEGARVEQYSYVMYGDLPEACRVEALSLHDLEGFGGACFHAFPGDREVILRVLPDDGKPMEGYYSIMDADGTGIASEFFCGEVKVRLPYGTARLSLTVQDPVISDLYGCRELGDGLGWNGLLQAEWR